MMQLRSSVISLLTSYVMAKYQLEQKLRDWILLSIFSSKMSVVSGCEIQSYDIRHHTIHNVTCA